MQPVLEVADRQHFLPGVGFNQFSVDFLLPFSELFVGMFEQILHRGIVTSFPVGLPPEIEGFDLRDDVGVNIFEVKGICTVGGNILEVAVDVMLGFAPVD